MSDNDTTISGSVSQSIVVTGTGNSVSLVIGSALSIPIERRQIRPVVRHQRGGQAARSELDLLNARTTLVPFVAREPELAGLREWLDAGVDLSVHALVAPAGTGKTRLAMELCRRVDPADAPGSGGWTAGFLKSSKHLEYLAGAFATSTYTWTGNTLLVVDYAGQSIEYLRQWLDLLAAKSLGTAKLRILLLERTAPREIGWWRTLVGVEVSSTDAPRRSLFWNSDLRPDELCGLGEVATRRRLFAAFLAAACERLGRAKSGMPAEGASPLFDRRLSEARFANPLALGMAGVLASRTSPLEALGLRHLEAARAIAEREVQRLRRIADTAENAIVHLASFNILAGGLPIDGLRDTVALELTAVHLGGGDVGNLVELLLQEYPADGSSGGKPRRLATPEPDLIAEAIVVQTQLSPDGEDDASAAALVERAYALGGAAAATVLMRLLQDFAFSEEDATATDHERDVAKKLLGWLVRLADACSDLETLAPIVEALPQNTLILREIAFDLTGRIVGALVAGNAPAEYLAPWLYNFGNRHFALGQREAALAEVEKAVVLYSALAAERPDAFRLGLAQSLTNFGVKLSALGSRETALASTGKAVALYRALAAERPDAFRDELAGALNNLGTILSTLKRREAALAATEEAVAILRELAAERPDAIRPDLASALYNLGNRLSDLGRHDTALAASEEAVNLYRALAAERPDAFLPDLAGALNNIGVRLHFLGQREAALAATEKAVAIRRELAAERPDAFRPDLAMALYNLGNRLSDLGQREAALKATVDSFDIYQALAEKQPDAFLPNLALSLTSLGNRLNALGLHEPALTAAKEAVDIYKALRAVQPDLFRPELAGTLNNLGNRLFSLGQHEAAVAAAEEAVAIRRELAAEGPDAFQPDFAQSLHNLGTMLSHLGRRDEAITATEEAVKLYRALAAEQLDAFLPDLAMSLNNLGTWLSELGRRKPALAAAEEAVALYRALAVEHPSEFEISLSVSLGTLADIRDASGDRKAALHCLRGAIDVLTPQFLALPDATSEWMAMYLQRYFAWSRALDRTPDMGWLAPIMDVLEKLGISISRPT